MSNQQSGFGGLPPPNIMSMRFPPPGGHNTAFGPRPPIPFNTRLPPPVMPLWQGGRGGWRGQSHPPWQHRHGCGGGGGGGAGRGQKRPNHNKKNEGQPMKKQVDTDDNSQEIQKIYISVYIFLTIAVKLFSFTESFSQHFFIGKLKYSSCQFIQSFLNIVHY